MENMKNTKITRKIGETYVDFELTDAEMESAFTEYQFQCDVIEVKARLKESGEYENWEEIPQQMIEELARQFRNEMTAIMDGMGDGRIPAMESVFKRHKEDLEEYKEKWKVFSVKVQQIKEHYYSIRARTEEEATDLLEKYIEDDDNRVNDDFEYEDSEYETLYINETEYEDPENADIKEEE